MVVVSTGFDMLGPPVPFLGNTDDEAMGETSLRVAKSINLSHNFTRKRPHKYGAKAVVVDGIRFDSIKEARYYSELKLRVRAGEVVTFLRQVPIHLPGQTRLVVDFLEFHADGTAHFVDTKGVQTPEFKLKKRQVEDLYPFTLEVV